MILLMQRRPVNELGQKALMTSASFLALDFRGIALTKGFDVAQDSFDVLQ